MNPPHLPSLTALRAFDLAARTGNFSTAARALNVTPAAVAQQVRGLERDLGLSLAFRHGRGLGLTAEGQVLAAALRDGMDGIAAAISQITTDLAASPLHITLTPAFASQWLMPRLGAFWKKHPTVPLSLHPSETLADLQRDRMDLAIRFGDGNWAGVQARLLFRAAHVVVAAPALLGGKQTLTLAEMTKLPWVFEEDWPEQYAFLRRIGIDPALLSGPKLPTEELALQAARQGYGLHVEMPAMIGDDLASGRLVMVHDGDHSGLGYFLITRPGPEKPALRLFIHWLRSVV